jgi:hypothetical protein
MAQENGIDKEIDLRNENGKTDGQCHLPDLTIGI